MRIVVAGDKDWSCPDLAARILRRLVARYSRDLVIIHGNETGVDASFAAAATELGIAAEARVIGSEEHRVSYGWAKEPGDQRLLEFPASDN